MRIEGRGVRRSDFRLSDSQIIRLSDGGETSAPLATGSIARGDFSTALEMTGIR